jgi:hypothetical protein
LSCFGLDGYKVVGPDRLSKTVPSLFSGWWDLLVPPLSIDDR